MLPDGTVLPCRRLPERVGHLREASLASIYRASPLLAALRGHRVARGCEDCFYARHCQGGLRCLALVGNDPGDLRHLADVPIVAPLSSVQRVREVHTVVLHLLCELVE